MPKDIELIPVIFDVVLIAGLLCFACIPLDRARIRARWATSVFVVGGTLGVMFHVVRLLLRMHWITLGHRADVSVDMLVSDIDNVLLGLILALIISGQLRGVRKSENTRPEPAI
jgi:hypothetical protein